MARIARRSAAIDWVVTAARPFSSPSVGEVARRRCPVVARHPGSVRVGRSCDEQGAPSEPAVRLDGREVRLNKTPIGRLSASHRSADG